MPTKEKTILFTGGGSAGHVTPNLALIDKFKAQGFAIHYIGSEDGIEKTIIEKKEIPYFAIKTGKMRRYFSWQNFVDPLKIIYGLCQSVFLVLKIKPAVVFSKGGFVSVPVVVAAKCLGKPVVVHESDITPGLANRLSFPFSNLICVTHAETQSHITNKKTIAVTGTPLRPGIFSGDKKRGLAFLGFNDAIPVLLIIGGGLGALTINKCVQQGLQALLQHYQIAHICGNGKVNEELHHVEGYRQFEYLHDELFDVFAASDMVLSRAGANAVNELVALKKLNLLIPLPLSASRGDQIANAAYFEKLGLSKVLLQENLTVASLQQAIAELWQQRATYQTALNQFELPDSVTIIYDHVNKLVKAQ